MDDTPVTKIDTLFTLVTETRPCGDCRNFVPMIGDIPICTKKLMGVTAKMHVSFRKEEGTCFEPEQ